MIGRACIVRIHMEDVMPIREINAADAGLPTFEIADAAGTPDVQVFSLSSHERASGALEFGLGARPSNSR